MTRTNQVMNKPLGHSSQLILSDDIQGLGNEEFTDKPFYIIK